MNDVIQKWKQRKIALEQQVNALCLKTIMDDEDAMQSSLAQYKLNLIKEIITDLEYKYV